MTYQYNTGRDLARALIARAAVVGGDVMASESYARRRWGNEAASVVQHIKGPVAGNEAASAYSSAAGIDFRAAAFARALPGMLDVQRIPKFQPMLTQTERSTAQWIEAGKAIKPYAGGYTRDAGLGLKKIGSLFVCSKETIEDGDGEEFVRTGLLSGFAREMNRAFIDPSSVEDDATPGSVTSGATPIDLSGGTIEDLDEALREALQALGPLVNMSSVRVVMSAALAGCLSLTRGTGGAPAYPGLTALGGTLAGLGVLAYDGTDSHSSSDGEFIALIDGSAVAYCDEAPEAGMSLEAMIEMDTAPTGDSVTPAAATQHLVSVFQEDGVCFKGTWRANWKLRRPDAVQVITGVPLSLGQT